MASKIKVSIDAEMHSGYHAEAKCERFWAETHGIETHGFYATESKARKALAEACASALATHAANAKNTRRVLLMCADGHALLLSFDRGWYYAIGSNARSYGSACMLAEPDYAKAYERAKSHADQCYGGIAWECTL